MKAQTPANARKGIHTLSRIFYHTSTIGNNEFNYAATRRVRQARQLGRIVSMRSSAWPTYAFGAQYCGASCLLQFVRCFLVRGVFERYGISAVEQYKLGAPVEGHGRFFVLTLMTREPVHSCQRSCPRQDSTGTCVDHTAIRGLRRAQQLELIVRCCPTLCCMCVLEFAQRGVSVCCVLEHQHAGVCRVRE